jgi:hypothetical protein
MYVNETVMLLSPLRGGIAQGFPYIPIMCGLFMSSSEL